MPKEDEPILPNWHINYESKQATGSNITKPPATATIRNPYAQGNNENTKTRKQRKRKLRQQTLRKSTHCDHSNKEIRDNLPYGDCFLTKDANACRFLLQNPNVLKAAHHYLQVENIGIAADGAEANVIGLPEKM